MLEVKRKSKKKPSSTTTEQDEKELSPMATVWREESRREKEENFWKEKLPISTLFKQWHASTTKEPVPFSKQWLQIISFSSSAQGDRERDWVFSSE